ncbi:MAG: Eco57I restriction-modification methylase domain-containing protein, partial [Acidimicrobiaceae bacterium]|nr:Eco57I restriction-modification methylase domain-containing protein [Acidimicrobiaceae bacterium]
MLQSKPGSEVIDMAVLDVAVTENTRIDSGRLDAANNLRHLADSLNEELERSTDRDQRSGIGQFTTPADVARTIASLVEPTGRPLRVIDPGAGTGALMLSLVADLIERGIEAPIEVDLVETDATAINLLHRAAQAARATAGGFGIPLETRIVERDFCDISDWAGDRRFDVAIMNPPYMKLNSRDPCRRMVLRRHGFDCPNLYAAFLAVATDLLRDGGQLVAITPRSFANGLYFTNFRKVLMKRAAFRRAILFDRRDRLFRSSSVLQETIIFSLTMSAAADSDSVRVETRSDHLTEPHQLHDVLHGHIVSPEDSQMFINLPANPAETQISSQVAALPADLTSLCLSVSTGPVVDFRSREYLTKAGVSGTVPLIYPANIKTTGVEWPVATAKPQGFAVAGTNRRMLFPNGPYVLTKRFTSKEQRRRVVAGVYLPVEGYDHVAFENHVNVVHRNRAPIKQSEAV